METVVSETVSRHASVPSAAGEGKTSPALLKQIVRQLRTQHFAVLSTVGVDGQPSSAGVSYGVSLPDKGLTFYVMTRRHLQKTRNIAQNPQVSLVVPVRRRLLWFLPPATIQLRGRAEILEATDKEGRMVFQRFWLGRRILKSYRAMERRGETRICFVKITPDPVVRSYMVGSNVLSLVRHMEAGAGKVALPPK
jgi:nitroimidazol reductase NimA-like FMN-containing flavoprotein (pyridoxamine 5'-phosphate oxidase superfamily)